MCLCLMSKIVVRERREEKREGGEEGEGKERKNKSSFFCIPSQFFLSHNKLFPFQQRKNAKLYKRNLSNLMSKHPNAGKRTERKIRVTWIYEAGFQIYL